MKSSVIVTLLLGCIPHLSLGSVFKSDKVQSGCGDSLSETYLSKIREANINLFAPSAYFRGDATKFISSGGETYLDTEKLCVDGAESYTGPIQLYDDGTHGDDFANDGVYTRDCVHYCEDKVDLNDFFGYAMILSWVYSRLIVVDESLKDTVPYEVLNTPLTPDATAIASSHAFFFADVDRKYYPNFPMSMSPNASDWPSGRSVGISALLSVFGDAFDYLTVTPLEKDHVEAISGAGIYKWQHWDRRGGPMINNRIGDIDECFMAVSGVPTYRLTGIVTNGDVVEDTGGENHELVHGVSGYSYHMMLEKARNGDNAHTPGACTTDHSSLQAPVWDWTIGYPEAIPATDPNNWWGVRIEPNDDCEQCDDNELTSCCSFRYLDFPNTRDKMLVNPELSTMSPLMLYIAGMIKADEVPEDKRTYYCMGSNTDGGCGIDGDRKSASSMFASKYWRDHYSSISNVSKAAENRPECVYKVDDSDRSKVTSDYVSRFTLDELIDANGGTRFPEERFKVVRNAAIHVSSRLPSQAEIVFYTMLWRHHETETEPWERLEEGSFPVEPWYFHTGGHSVLHSRLHGIECGDGGANVPSCSSGDSDVCDGYPCGPGAVCKDLDGRPFCMCRDGLVGDGIECTFASETMYDKRPSAHELGGGDDKDYCFAENSDWTDFVSASSLPPYPGGQAPYSPTSCGSKVCPVGWRCNAKLSKCLKPTGSSMCETQSDLSKGQCLALGCCKWVKGQCKRKNRRNKCLPPKDPAVKKTCTDLNTCCYFDCDYLTLDDESQIGQVGNCGYDCTTGIKPDLNGVKHPELYLWPDIYITNGGMYDYDTGPMNIQGNDKNMFDRCMNSCFTGGEDDPRQKFLFRIKPDDTLLLRNCGWLSSRRAGQKRTICTGNAYNLSQRGYKSARIACPETCARFL